MRQETPMPHRQILILLSFLFFQAQGSANLNCSHIFAAAPRLMGVEDPARVLSALGLKEGTGFYGEKDKSIQIVKRKKSPASILLDRFQQRWPKATLYYSLRQPHEISASEQHIRALMRMGKHVAQIHIPLAILGDYWRLEAHISRLNDNLKKVEVLLSEPVDFRATHMTSLGFEIEIDGFSNQPLNSYLAWMWRRQERHQMRFTFTNSLFEPNFSPRHWGLSTGRGIYLVDFLLLSENDSFPAYLAHEIVHSTNNMRFEKYGDVSSRISFHAGELNTVGLLGENSKSEGYRRAFSTDEMEAWLITEKFSPQSVADAEVSYRDFLHNQIEWLTELRRILPSQLMEFETAWVGWVRRAPKKNAFMAAPWISIPSEADFKFVIFRGSPEEVIINIPRVQSKIDQMGARDFLLEAIDRRLMQLNNRALLTN